MKRRDVLTATAIIASPICGSAVEPKARTLRLGVLASSEIDTGVPEGEGFVAALGKHGFVAGRNLVIERRFSREKGLDAAASALVALKVDVILVLDGTQSALAAKRATSSIPIVFTSADPVGFGLVSSLARPGGNLTGVSIQGPAITSREIEAMAEALGALRRLAYIHAVGSRSLPWFSSYVAAATSAARTLGVQIEFHEVSALAAFEPLVKELARRRVDAVELMPSTAALTRTKGGVRANRGTVSAPSAAGDRTCTTRLPAALRVRGSLDRAAPCLLRRSHPPRYEADGAARRGVLHPQIGSQLEDRRSARARHPAITPDSGR